jgi:hypothetical protein
VDAAAVRKWLGRTDRSVRPGDAVVDVDDALLAALKEIAPGRKEPAMPTLPRGFSSWGHEAYLAKLQRAQQTEAQRGIIARAVGEQAGHVREQLRRMAATEGALDVDLTEARAAARAVLTPLVDRAVGQRFGKSTPQDAEGVDLAMVEDVVRECIGEIVTEKVAARFRQLTGRLD